jgi:hypothetical protein
MIVWLMEVICRRREHHIMTRGKNEKQNEREQKNEREKKTREKKKRKNVRSQRGLC